MKIKYPNTSILHIITQNENDIEKVLFFYVKPIVEYCLPDTLHWYEKCGKNGKSVTVWTDLKIKQWVVAGTDEKILTVTENFLSTSKLEIDGKRITFSIPNENFEKKPELSIKYLVSDNVVSTLPSIFFQKNNLRILSGYNSQEKIDSGIKALYPFRFFEEDFIYHKLKKGIWGVIEKRSPTLKFHEINDKEIAGFYQQNFEDTAIYCVIVRNGNDEEIGRTSIEKENGLFNVQLTQSTNIYNIEIRKDGIAEKYIQEWSFIKSINIKLGLDERIRDIYEQKFDLISKNENKVPKFIGKTWQKIDLDEKIGEKNLSNIFKEILNYLGPMPIIVDPYFLGELKDKIFNLSHCQNAFLNALILAILQKDIHTLTIVGNSRFSDRLKNKEGENSPEIENLEEKCQDSDLYLTNIEDIEQKEDREESTKIEKQWERYQLVDLCIRRNINSVAEKLHGYKTPDYSIKIKYCNERFHNRYWFSSKEEEGILKLEKCIIVTNSFGNMKEVDFIEVTDENQLLQIITKYLEIIQQSEEKLVYE